MHRCGRRHPVAHPRDAGRMARDYIMLDKGTDPGPSGVPVIPEVDGLEREAESARQAAAQLLARGAGDDPDRRHRRSQAQNIIGIGGRDHCPAVHGGYGDRVRVHDIPCACARAVQY